MEMSSFRIFHDAFHEGTAPERDRRHGLTPTHVASVKRPWGVSSGGVQVRSSPDPTMPSVNEESKWQHKEQEVATAAAKPFEISFRGGHTI